MDSLPNYYKSQEGVNNSISQSATSSDGQITATTTYDFLDGEHPIPVAGGAAQDAYFYQSVIMFYETGIEHKQLPACSVSPSKT